MASWIKHSVDRFVIVSIFIPKLRLILILNSFLGSSDSLVFSELFHSLAPRPLAARRSEERFSRNAETDLVCRLLLEKKKKKHIADIGTRKLCYCYCRAIGVTQCS